MVLKASGNANQIRVNNRNVTQSEAFSERGYFFRPNGQISHVGVHQKFTIAVTSPSGRTYNMPTARSTR